MLHPLIGDIRLTYFGQWDYIPNSMKTEAVQRMYVAPGKALR